MTTRRYFGVAVLVAAALVPLAPIVGSLRTSGRVIVTADDVVREDLYAFGGRVIIEGTVEGDVFTFTNDLTITGTVTGDVVGVVGGPVRISGDIGGSIRLAAVSLDVTGSVRDDVAAAAFESVVAADVGRDVLVFGGELVSGGRVGRDVRSQVWSLEVHGEIGRDVLARVDDITLGPGADVGGDVEFQSSDRVAVDAAALVGGRLVQREVISPVWAKATVRVLMWLSLFAFIVGGLLGVWLFRGTMPRAVRSAVERPWRSAAVGIAVLLAVPLAVLPLGLSLVGLPVAVVLMVTWVMALVLGATPAVAAVGSRMIGDRGGYAGAFIVGAVAWRLAIWILSLVAALLYLAATVVGIGAFAIGAWEQRKAASGEWQPLPPAT